MCEDTLLLLIYSQLLLSLAGPLNHLRAGLIQQQTCIVRVLTGAGYLGGAELFHVHIEIV